MVDAIATTSRKDVSNPDSSQMKTESLNASSPNETSPPPLNNALYNVS